MIHSITSNSVSEALSSALCYMQHAGVEETSRNGSVLVAPTPVCTTYRTPRNRVLFSPMRNANPFFHLMEALWMLSGQNDLAWPMFFNKRFKEYSDDGLSIHGAYGDRWRNWFGVDQLKSIIELLRRDPNSRRAVLQMWSAESDLLKNGKDVPCNTHIYFDLRQGELNMTVCCRSNDLWWGVYGANVVHFSMLQEYLAAWLEVPIGEYRQFSNNFHLYTDVVRRSDLINLAVDVAGHNYYRGEMNYPFVSAIAIQTNGISMNLWDVDLHRFMSDPAGDTLYYHQFFNNVAAPMYAAWSDRKNGRNSGLISAQEISAPDWRVACVEWINRSEKKKESSNNE